jgi:formate dehydrogenase subunit gamma
VNRKNGIIFVYPLEWEKYVHGVRLSVKHFAGNPSRNYYTEHKSDNGGDKPDAIMSSSKPIPADVIEAAVLKYAEMAGGLMPLLHDIQAQLGHIPKDLVAVIAAGMGLSRAEVHGVISFYHDFHTKPRGQTTIQVCRAEACQAMGSRALEQHVKTRLGIDYGGTTADGRISLEPVYCLGNCACAPSIRIADDVYARVDEKRFDELMAGI